MSWGPTAWTTALAMAWKSFCRQPARHRTQCCIMSLCRTIEVSSWSIYWRGYCSLHGQTNGFLLPAAVHIKHTDGHFEYIPYFSLPANDLNDVIAPSCYSCFDYPNALADLVCLPNNLNPQTSCVSDLLSNRADSKGMGFKGGRLYGCPL